MRRQAKLGQVRVSGEKNYSFSEVKAAVCSAASIGGIRLQSWAGLVSTGYDYALLGWMGLQDVINSNVKAVRQEAA